MNRCSQSSPHAARNDGGFTLIELLVALVLLAMLVALFPSVMRLTSRAWSTAAELEQGTGLETASMFIEQRLTEAMPLFDRDSDGSSRIAFTGEERLIRFVAPLASGPQGAGLYRLELRSAVDEEARGEALILRLFSYAPVFVEGTETSPLEQRSVARGLAGIQFRYFGAPSRGAAAVWSTSWVRRDRLPDIVELAAPPERAYLASEPPLRVALRLQPSQ